MRGLSLVAASWGHSSSRCTGLSLSRPLLLRSTGSRRTGSVVVAHGRSCSVACGTLPRPELEPVSPALTGRFSTTGPPGKLCSLFLKGKLNNYFLQLPIFRVRSFYLCLSIYIFYCFIFLESLGTGEFLFILYLATKDIFLFDSQNVPSLANRSTYQLASVFF